MAPADHASVFGESERLLAPVLYIARRTVFTPEEWTDWFARLAAPAPFASWDGTFASEAKLRKRHNRRCF